MVQIEFDSDDDVCGKSSSTATANGSEVIFGLHQHTPYNLPSDHRAG